MIEPHIYHDPKASEVLRSILEWPVQDQPGRTPTAERSDRKPGDPVRLIDAYDVRDLPGLILGNLNREQMVLIRVDTVEALIAQAVNDAVHRVISQDDTGSGAHRA